MAEKIKIDWGEIRIDSLTEEDRYTIISELNKMAKNMPEGFDFKLISGKESECKKYIKENFNVVMVDINSRWVAIYQNIQDCINRESLR